MKVFELPLSGAFVLEPRKFSDERGFFSETFRDDWALEGVRLPRFVQDNHSLSLGKGTVRGLHHQRAPMAQTKLVRALRGTIWDVIVDARPGSPTFGRHVSVELGASNWRQLLIPEGFLHGFCALTDDVEVFYKVSAYYAADCDGAVRWNDPALAIDWPVSEKDAILSPRDKAAPMFHEVFGPVASAP